MRNGGITRAWGLALRLAGAVWRSFFDRFAERVSIKDFGADGTALYDALAAGKRVLVPSDIAALTLTAPQVDRVLTSLDLIDPEAELTINLPAGTTSRTKQIITRSPGVHFIKLKGAALVAVGSPTAVAITSNGVGDHDIEFTLPNDLAIGDYVRIDTLVGTGGYKQLEGIWPVTAADAGNFTVNNTSQNAAIVATVTAGDVRKFETVLEFTGANIQAAGRAYNDDPGAFEPYSTGLTLENLAIVSDGADADAHGIMQIGRGSHLKTLNCGIHGFANHGIWALKNSHGEHNGMFVSASGNDGIVSQLGAVVECINGAATGCGNVGYSASAGIIYNTNITCAGNGSNGCQAEDSGVLHGPATVVSVYNVGSGLRTTNNGYADYAGATLSNNAQYGYYGDDTSSADLTGATLAGNTLLDIRLDDVAEVPDLSGVTYTTLHRERGEVVKAATETRNADGAVLASDAELKFHMLANTKYKVRLVVMFNTSANADFKFRHAGPAAPALVRLQRRSIAVGAAADGNIAVDNDYSAADVAVTSGSAGGGYVILEGVVHNGANAGNFEFRWAQNTSDASNTSVWAGSRLEWQKA